jgi:glycosyltransferase involved in cell wall biosynthesis
MESKFKYSFVIPMYNSAQWMDKAINSVLNQSYSNWELICVDDGSQDETVSKIEYLMKSYSQIKLLKQKNSGPAIARESAIKIASGDYIVYLDSDDYVSIDYLSEIQKQTANYPDVIVPELMSQKSGSAFYSFNNINGLNVGRSIAGKDAFRMTFPWKIHGFACYKTSLMKRFAVGDNAHFNNYNSDEYITRVIFLNSSLVVISGGKYFHVDNEDSITKRSSIRQLSYLMTEEKLITLTENNDSGYLDNVMSDSLRKLFRSYYAYRLNWSHYDVREKEIITKKHKSHYSLLKQKQFCYIPDGSKVKDVVYKCFKVTFYVAPLAVFLKKLKI